MKVYKLEMMGKTLVFGDLDALVDDVFVALSEGGCEEITVKTSEMTEEEYQEMTEFPGW